MKRAKFLFLSIIMMGIIGVAFALKTNKAIHYIYTGTIGSGSCTVLVYGSYISVGETVNVAASTSSNTWGCPDVYTCN